METLAIVRRICHISRNCLYTGRKPAVPCSQCQNWVHRNCLKIRVDVNQVQFKCVNHEDSEKDVMSDVGQDLNPLTHGSAFKDSVTRKIINKLLERVSWLEEEVKQIPDLKRKVARTESLEREILKLQEAITNSQDSEKHKGKTSQTLSKE